MHRRTCFPKWRSLCLTVGEQLPQLLQREIHVHATVKSEKIALKKSVLVHRVAAQIRNMILVCLGYLNLSFSDMLLGPWRQESST